MNTLLALALAIGAGLLLSRLAKLVHLPNVTAFLVGGLLIGPSVLGLLDAKMVGSFSIVTEAALGFIAYAIGAEFRLDYIKQIGVKPVIITLFQALTALALVDIVLVLAGFPLPLAITMGAIATATAPAATLMVIRQYKAKGVVSDMLLPVVAMDDAVGLVAFAISTAIAQALVSGAAPTAQAMVFAPLLEIVESLALGSGLGVALAFLARFFKSRGNKLALSIMVVFLGIALCDMWGLSSLLVCMMIGAAMTNLSRDAKVLLEQCDRFTPPLFLLFFVISGAELDLSVLPTVGLLGVLYVLVRALGKWLGAFVGSAAVKAPDNVRKYLGLTLIPQAGVAIGMAGMVMDLLPTYGAQIRAVVLAATLVYELVGPVLTKLALQRAGEIAPTAPKTPKPAKA